MVSQPVLKMPVLRDMVLISDHAFRGPFLSIHAVRLKRLVLHGPILQSSLEHCRSLAYLCLATSAQAVFLPHHRGLASLDLSSESQIIRHMETVVDSRYHDGLPALRVMRFVHGSDADTVAIMPPPEVDLAATQAIDCFAKNGPSLPRRIEGTEEF
ncbi:unnamed protein product [Mycena citricolor]|uniref:Uncharacterized protein n=1 Tax=Mycena citricolor TaxID=2018698 RepID=A0AAD2HX00_9AGAR|nr:unnamed protein product [Mycena citricolor]